MSCLLTSRHRSLSKSPPQKPFFVYSGAIINGTESQSSQCRFSSDNTPYEKIGNNEPVSIADEVPFEIPDTWEWVRWGTLSESIQYGYNAPALDSGRIKMVRISDIQDNMVLWDTVPYCNIDESDIETYLLKPNDILFARTGGTVGKSYLVQDVPDEAIYAGYLIRTRYSRELCPQYLKYFMESELYWSQLREGTIATAQPNCNGKTLGNMLVPIPPKEEQLRIVQKLNAVMQSVQEYGIAYEKAKLLDDSFPEQLKKSILQMAVQGKLVPQNPDDEPASVLLERIRAEKQRLIAEGKIKRDKHESVIFRRDNSHYEKCGLETICIDDEVQFDIPQSWGLIRLNDIGDYRKGPFGSSLTKSMFVPKSENSVKVYEQKNAIQKDHKLGYYYIRREYYDSKMSGFTVLPGDIIVSCAGTIGETYIMPDDIELGIINQALMRMRIFAPIDLDYFLLYFDYVIKQEARDNSKGSAIKNIPPFDVFKRMLFPVPPIGEQKRIVNQVRLIMQLCDTL